MRLPHFTGGVVLVLTLVAPRTAPGCGFSDGVTAAVTLHQEVAAAKLVVYARPANPRPAADGSGSTDLIVARVIKSHPIIGNKKVLKLPRYLPADDPGKAQHFLVFCDIVKGEIDPYRGVPAGPATIDYLKGLLALDGSDRARLLRYCFDFLDHREREMAADAFLEFMKTPDRDFRAAARKLPAAKLRGWLKDSATPPERLRLYGFLLGNCGGARDAALLRSLLERQAADPRPALFDGVLTGYVLLRPKEGRSYLRQLMGNSDNHFMVRYSGLRAARFFFNTRPEVIRKADVLELLCLPLSQPDMADLPVEYLRQCRCWDVTDRVLPLYDKPSHDARVVRRAVLRYALQCPRAEAGALVARVRKADAQLVTDTEEVIKYEQAR